MANRFTSCLTAIFLSFAASAVANTIVVDLNGTGDYEAMSPAVAAAATGDTVLVLPGYYEGSENSTLDFEGKDLILRSRDGYESVTINVYMFDHVFVFQNGESRAAVVEGLTLTRGSTVPLWCDGASPTLRGCRFTENYTGQGGPISSWTHAVGAVRPSSSPLFENCIFDDNTALSGISVIGFHDCDVTFRGCTFAGNHEGSAGYYIFPHGVLSFKGTCNATFESCTFIDNLSYESLMEVWDHANVSFLDCAFMGNGSNRSHSELGLLHFANSGSVLLQGCTFSGNVNLDSCISVSGAANVSIDHCTLAGNSGEATKVISVSTTRGVINLSNSVLAFNDCQVPIACDGTLPTISACCFYESGDPDSMCAPYDPESLLLEDPLFCGFYDDDYTLCLNSPCLVPNNDWGVQIGSHGWGCDTCGSPVEATSWGAIKAMFR